MDKEMRINRRLEVTKGIAEGKAGVDREYEDDKSKGCVRGFAVMTKGFVKDMRGWEIDEKTLDQIVKCGKEAKKLGMKSRFGHPNMSSTALGTFLGRAKNFRRDGDIVRADLFLDKTAYTTPEGDLATYVLDLAENDPDAFGTSVVLGDFDFEYRIEKDGTRQKDENGNVLPPLLRVKSLMAVDVVDDPAANNGMFNSLFNESVELSAKASGFLDQLLSSPEALDKVIAFLERYRVNRGGEDLSTTSEEGGTGQFTGKSKEAVMEFKDITKDQLQKERPELVADLRNEAVTEERSRCLSIVKSANAEFKGMGMEPLVEEGIDKGQSLDASMSAMRGKRLQDLQADGNKAPGADLDKEPEVKKSPDQAHLDKAKKYAEEHKCSITEALLKTAEPDKK